MTVHELNTRLTEALASMCAVVDQLRADNDQLRDTLAAERADRDQERREADAALAWGEAA